jgi:hypothetical protein
MKKFASQIGCKKRLIIGKLVATRMWVCPKTRKMGKKVTS